MRGHAKAARVFEGLRHRAPDIPDAVARRDQGVDLGVGDASAIPSRMEAAVPMGATAIGKQ